LLLGAPNNNIFGEKRHFVHGKLTNGIKLGKTTVYGTGRTAPIFVIFCVEIALDEKSQNTFYFCWDTIFRRDTQYISINR
jgi:hypothetical protein